MLRTSYSREITPKLDGKEVTVAGWISKIRKFGSLCFISLRDREGTIQLTAPKKVVKPDTFKTITKLGKEWLISCTGYIKANPEAPNGLEIIPDDVRVLSKAKAPLPLDVSNKIESDLDTRLDNRILDLRKSDILEIFRVKSQALAYSREFFLKNGLIEINTPKIVSAGAEGGANLFKVNYFDTEVYLAQSPQLYKQMLMASGLDKVFEIGPAYRAEKFATVRHTTEFLSVDAEIAFIENLEDLLEFHENYIIYLIKKLDFKLKYRKPFPRISYSKAIELLQLEKKIEWGVDIDTQSEKLLGKLVYEKFGTEIYFIYNYPSEIKPFYIMDNDDETCRSFDLELKGIEITSGGQREHRYQVLCDKMKTKGLALENFKYYLQSFEYGMPPHGGFGFGIERFIQIFFDKKNIREAILFPRDRKRIYP